jgi:hypothetical protein
MNEINFVINLTTWDDMPLTITLFPKGRGRKAAPPLLCGERVRVRENEMKISLRWENLILTGFFHISWVCSAA